MSGVFWLDARVIGLPSLTDAWVSELRDALSRTAYVFPLEVVVILPPLLAPTVRRRVGLLAPDDIVGSTSSSEVAASGAVVLDSRVRQARGATAGWLLTIEGHRDRLRSASIPVALMPAGWRIDPPTIDDIEAPLWEHARRTGAGW